MTYGNTKSSDDVSSCQLFLNFFESVFTNGNITNSIASFFISEHVSLSGLEFSFDEIHQALLNICLKKGAGLDNIPHSEK